MCYIEDCTEVVEYIDDNGNIQQTRHRDAHDHSTQRQQPSASATKTKADYQLVPLLQEITAKGDEERIHHYDLDVFFRSIGSIFITFITSNTLNNLLLSKVINGKRNAVDLNYILCNNSLLSIFSSELDMIERCHLFNSKHGALHDINIECTIWNLSYFNMQRKANQFRHKYHHKQMMKMMISYICINGMHPFLGIDCDNSPNCQWSVNPKCRIRTLFEKLLANTDEYEVDGHPHYDFAYRDAWKMRQNTHNLLIDVSEMIDFLFVQTEHSHEIGDYDIFDMDGFDSFANQKFTLFTFKNECDFSYKIQFDIVYCDADLNVIDDFKISLFGKKLHFGSYPCLSTNFNRNYWQKIKNVLLGYQFVNVDHWYIISIQSIDTTLNGVEENKCYYLICAEVNGTYINMNGAGARMDVDDIDQMYTKLMVWKSCFFSEQQPYGHE